jgi:monofunctional biosynthetic peptidoglycan transglycosylase
MGSLGAAYLSYDWVYGQYRKYFPDTAILKDAYPVALGKHDNRNVYRFSRAAPDYWRHLSQISKYAIDAVLVAEDGGFYQHSGYEPDAIRAAWEHNQKPGVKVKRGGSTISQQVVKNIFLSPEKTFTRKIRELLLAVDMERKLPKRRILEIYLNIAEWGPGIYGVERAAQHYFHKSSIDLTVRESAILAFMLPSPERYQASFADGHLTEFGSGRVDTILEHMSQAGYISPEEYTSAKTESAIPYSSWSF